jgi:hypothetical protein
MTYAAEDAWVRLEARLRDPQATELCGFGVWTPKGFDWAYRRFKADRVEGYGLIEAAPFENEHLLRVVPDYYQRLESSYDSGFFEQEVLGKYVKLDAGAVYREFERSKSVESIRFPFTKGFARNRSAHLIGVFRTAEPWNWERRLTHTEGHESVVLWAFDQFSMIGYRLPLSDGVRRSRLIR